MEARINFNETRKGFLDSLLKVGEYLHGAQIDEKLHHLLAYRVSQINGCAFCLDMHHKDAIHAGDTEQRIHGMPAWRESPWYSDAERAAFALAEDLTLHNESTDENYTGLLKYFTKEQIADMVLIVSMTGTWNRVNKAFRTVPGGYQPGAFTL
ncbi:MAG TPA: carboxymuconolactone decarboxylase family protein [Dinghuibacter sp.]|uniref:carboxymuconolactone decarboxylase family protein n=1 Tax=Dinghuibacter sp. TaxID=2024697 RepID=UPI002B617C85|nr:carboxymuconolactone decarboxylase family protein [Dinghuibacter sp.]HTJ14942.1 carboxymuconolactone decarboxylase family protein [Dinghuibacter sp.]